VFGGNLGNEVSSVETVRALESRELGTYLIRGFLPSPVSCRVLTPYPAPTTITDPVFILLHSHPSPQPAVPKKYESIGNHERFNPMITDDLLQFHPLPAEIKRALQMF